MDTWKHDHKKVTTLRYKIYTFNGKILWVLRLAVSNTSQPNLPLSIFPLCGLEPSAAQTVGPDMW